MRPVLATPAERQRARRWVEASEDDVLAPFVLRVGKSYFESSDGLALLAYAVRLRTAVVSGDPIGDRASFPLLVNEFRRYVRRQGWRLAVLGAGEQTYQLWEAHGLHAISIGRDVVVPVEEFALVGRRWRNLRQAVQRSRNAGVEVAFSTEATLDPELARQLLALRDRSHKASDRGFSMLLGNVLDGTYPDSVIAVAFDRTSRPVAFQRYLKSGPHGLTLDLPVRDPGAPGGVDERLIVEVLRWSQEHGVRWVSLAFAPFADLYAASDVGLGGRLARGALHALDPLIRLRRLYRFLRKFHALGGRRFVLLRWRDLVPAVLAMLLLEFR